MQSRRVIDDARRRRDARARRADRIATVRDVPLGRYLPMGVATLLVGVFVLGAATSSAQRQPVSALAVVDAPAAQLVGVAPRPVLGFAPPAAPAVAVADLPRALAPALPSGPLGIPGIMLRAYKLAADRVGAESPACKLPWFLLAGIGRIESGHAGDGSVDTSGTTINPIAGPVLDGSLAGNEVITDTDRGAIDGDATHDRAMGPMQFIPSTWAAWGADANGDGKADPNNIFDATYSAGRYLCAGVSDIMSEQRRVSSVLRYNNSLDYAMNVLTWASAYATGVTPTPGTIEPRRAPTTQVAAPVPAPGRVPGGPRPAPGDTRAAPPGSPVPGSGTPAPVGRFAPSSKAITTTGTIVVTSPAGPVTCTLDLAGTTSADGATISITRATLGGPNALCGLGRTVGLPWTLTAATATTVELSGVGVDALGAHCGPATVAGTLGAALDPTTKATGACVIRSMTVRPIAAITQS